MAGTAGELRQCCQYTRHMPRHCVNSCANAASACRASAAEYSAERAALLNVVHAAVTPGTKKSAYQCRRHAGYSQHVTVYAYSARPAEWKCERKRKAAAHRYGCITVVVRVVGIVERSVTLLLAIRRQRKPYIVRQQANRKSRMPAYAVVKNAATAEMLPTTPRCYYACRRHRIAGSGASATGCQRHEHNQVKRLNAVRATRAGVHAKRCRPNQTKSEVE